MHYIAEMHVMPITFQLLLHYNKFLHVSYFKTLLQDCKTKITTKFYISTVKIFCYKCPQYYKYLQ